VQIGLFQEIIEENKSEGVLLVQYNAFSERCSSLW